MTIRSLTIAMLATSSIGLLLVGCGGGASATPTVTYKAGGDSSSSGGGPVTKIDGTGTLTGSIKLVGNVPAPEIFVAKGAAKKDPGVCAADTAIVDEGLQVGAGNGIANVFVYIDKAPPGATVPAVPTEAAIFDQKGCVFIPHAMIVRTNQTVRIKSQDDAAHNTKTDPSRSRPFDSAIPARESVGVTLVYNKHELEPFVVRCSMHTWMKAYHLALNHPWGTITKVDGSFELKGLPATTLTLRIWHERAGSKAGGFLQRSLEVTIPKDGTVSKDLEFPLSKFAL